MPEPSPSKTVLCELEISPETLLFCSLLLLLSVHEIGTLMTQTRRRCLSGSLMSVSDRSLHPGSGFCSPSSRVPQELPSHAGGTLQTRNWRSLLLSLCSPQGYPHVQQKEWLLDNGAWHRAVTLSCAAPLWAHAWGAQMQAFFSGQRGQC